MADIKYPDSTPVDEPVAKPKPKAAAKPAPKASAPTTVQYPDSVPVDEPVKKMAKGGSASSRADGCCVKGKTKGMFV